MNAFLRSSTYNPLFMKELLATMKKNSYGKNGPKAVGLFSGCGGLDFGFKKAGFDIIFANDIDPSVKETYEKNVGPIEIQDITQLNKAKLPKADIVLAGIPCQPFSNAGKRKSTKDERGNLFEHVIEILKIKQPKIVLFENVRGFLSAKDEDGRSMPDRMKHELRKAGYSFYYKLMNASDYGVPQNRYRVIMIGIKKELDKGFTFPSPILNKSKLTVGNIILKKLPRDEQHEVWALPPQSIKIIEHIPEGGSWKSVPDKHLPPRLLRIKKEIKKYRSPNFYRRFSLDEIMGTVTAASTPENSGIVHPTENRRYSVREIARFQSFPDSFKFIGPTVSKKYKMIGNAVPVILAYHIAKAIKEQYFEN